MTPVPNEPGVFSDERGCWFAPERGTTSSGFVRDLHVQMYVKYRGPLPQGRHVRLHHWCRRGPEGCVNPMHMRPVSAAANCWIAYAERTGQHSPKYIRVARWLHKQVGMTR
jgi:hypothetical protein